MIPIDRRNILIALLLIACVLLGMRSCSQQEKQQSTERVMQVLGDSVREYRNAQDKAVAAIDVIEIDRKGLLETIHSRDEMIAKLQATVEADKHATAAAVFKARAEGKAAGATKVVPQYVAVKPVSTLDTQPAKECPPAPIYKADVVGAGIAASITAGPDSVTIDKYMIEQEFAVTFTSRKPGFFKKRVKEVQVTALTHGGTVTDVRSFVVPEDKPRRGLWAAAGAGLAVLAKIAVGVLLL